MHIPDGFLDTKTWLSTSVIGAGVLGYAVKRTRLNISPRQVPKIALVGAFIFAAQMLNFPVAGATSGHFLGGTLAAILFGPFTGSIIMSSVIIIQALVFQDGGITALGANVLCMGFVSCFAGYGIYRAGARTLSPRWHAVAAFVAAWFAVVIASAVVACLIAVSGTVPLGVALPAMAGWHSLIGIGEGLITAFATSYLGERKATAALGASA